MRIAYIVLTCKKYESTRIPWQKDTVFYHVDPQDIYYLGERMDSEKRLFSWGAGDDYDSLPYKFLDFFRHSCLNYDWYFLMDDDTFLYVDRFQQHVAALSIMPHEQPYAEGHVLTHIANSEWGVYHSGGAGTLLSAYTYHAVQDLLKGFPSNYRTPHWCADISLGMWLKSIPDIQLVHNNLYHYESAKDGDHVKDALTFHHLSTQDDYLRHYAFL
jgi:hypothetical protein